MDQRYDQIQSGIPNSSNIILYADPTTGELFKCPLSDIIPAATPLFVASKSGIENNSAGVTTTYLSYTFAANELNASGRGIDIMIYFEFLTNTAGASVTIYQNGNLLKVITPAAFSRGWWHFNVMKESSTQGTQFSFGYRGSSLQISQQETSSGWDYTNTIKIDIKFTATNANCTRIYWATIQKVSS